MSEDHNHLNHATWECKYTPKYRRARGYFVSTVGARRGDDSRLHPESGASG
jgi:hypothetical protein